MTLRTLQPGSLEGWCTPNTWPPSLSIGFEAGSEQGEPPPQRQRPPLGAARRVHFPLVTAAHVTSTASPALRVFPAGPQGSGRASQETS